MRFTDEDVLRFATWSADCNPLHVDPAFARRTHFGQPLVHGMLSVIEALEQARLLSADPPGRLEIEFRGAVVTDREYTLVTDRQGGTFTASLSEGGPVLVIRGFPEQSAEARGRERDLSWVSGVEPAGRQAEPVERTLADLRQGLEVRGTYAGLRTPASAGGNATPVAARVLALCSYVIGMQLPGRRSLFMNAAVEFEPGEPPAPTANLCYRARTLRFDPHFRILDVELSVATPDARPVASARLRSYVPFSPALLDIGAIRRSLASPPTVPNGKVALVIGGTRGLGAEISARLAVSGWRVYPTFLNDAASVAELRSALGDTAELVTPLQGDAADRRWCESAVEEIRQRHSRLDLLVLNACAPPLSSSLSAADDQGMTYVADNLRLVASPLSAALPALDAAGGGIVYISSAFVDENPAGFSSYVALKQAGESLARTAAREAQNVYSLIVRPPRLQTTWNDTPTGVAGAIPAGRVASHLLARLRGPLEPGRTEFLTDFPDPGPDERDESRPEELFTLPVAATFTADPVLPGLEFWLKELGLGGGVELAPYGQLMQTLLDPASPFATTTQGANIVFLRGRDWLRELPAERAAAPDFLREYLRTTVRDLERALRSHRASARVDTLLVLCPSPDTRAVADPFVAEAEAELVERVQGMPGLQIVRAEEWHALYGIDTGEAADPLREKLGHIPYKDSYFDTLATIVARHLHRRLSLPRKVVVVDCDNTLWGGVVGEAGAEGIRFDRSHLELHETLTRLSAGGMLVALCSKNEEPDVWRVFDTRRELTLRRDQIVAAAVNWLPKSENLRTLASRLNLGLDSFIFIDDNPVECAEVRARCPEVLTIEWPTDPAAALRLLGHTWELDVTAGTAEDHKRTQMYREEFSRQALKEDALSFTDFIDNLGLQVDIRALDAQDYGRASQLTLRTNQFNFTTRRRDESEMAALASSAGPVIRTVRVRDRFGDYGLVGLLIVDTAGETWSVDTLLLSCRVLGRGVEHRIVAEIGRLAREAGARHVRLELLPTKKNTPARNFLESIAAEGARRPTAGGVECVLTSDQLAEVRFVPGDSAPASIVEGTEPPAAPSPVDGERLRERERQIARTVSLADAAALTAAIHGRSGGEESHAAAAHGDAADRVYQAFASALRVPVEQVKELDRLDALGCDSMKIVEITVALLEKYPALPSTLLFEHRTVSAIVREIAKLLQPRVRDAGAPEPRPALRAPAPPDSGALDVAVVGMHLRCAGANSPAELWDLLSAARSAVAPVPPDREAFLHPLVDTRPHWAGLLDDVAAYDPEFFGIAPREAEVMDPQVRLFLQTAWAALEDAGYAGADHEQETGVFVGVMYGDYRQHANDTAKDAGSPYRSWEGFSLANRLSQVLGLRGPSLAVDTACSSSGTALHLACQALKAGDCRAAVVGGVNLILDPDRFGSLGRLGILSATGTCLPFGAGADGTVLGEGAGVVVLRPLTDALRRGDRIYGVIKGSGLSTGHGTVGFTAPNPKAQAEAVQRSLRSARIDPRTISYVETHGTGTELGDPIEVRGLSLAYSEAAAITPELHLEHTCALGSIKPNIGHLEAGAGVLGLIKVLLQMERGIIVPSISSDRPNPHIPFAGGPFRVQRELTPWAQPVGQINGRAVTLPRRAGLSSFGVGGANAHFIVEEAPPRDAASSVDRPVHLLALSARNERALARRAAELGRFLQRHADISAADVCFSAAAGRQHFETRIGLSVSTREEAIEALGAAASRHTGAPAAHRMIGGAAPTVAFLFTGQGAQYVGMGQELYETQPVFRSAIDDCARVLDALLPQPLLKVLFALPGSEDARLLDQTGFTQPALFALEYALAQLWRSWGIEPAIVVGHSVGEFAAMVVAGGMSLADGLELIAARGRLMQALPPGGVMTSVMASDETVEEALSEIDGAIAIAAINGPSQVVISGAEGAVAAAVAALHGKGVRTRQLTVSHAFHSPLMEPMLAEYRAVVQRIRLTEPSIPFVSSVTGSLATSEITRPEYWIRQVMQPVRFADAIGSIASTGPAAWLEIGPQPVLIGMARQCVEPDAGALWLSSLRKDAQSWRALLDSLGQLYAAGANIDWRAFDAPYRRRRVTLPAYPFSDKPYWIRSRRPARPTADVEPVISAALERQPKAYELSWKSQPRGAAAQAAPRRDWIVLADAAGVGQALAEQLRQFGATCTIVPRPAALAPAGLDGLFGTLVSGSEATGIVHLWSLDAPASGAGIADTVEGEVVDALQVLQALGRCAPGTRAWFVTAAAVPHRISRPMSLTQAPLWGLARTAALEQPANWGGIVDLSSASAGAEELAALALELLSPDEEDQLALRGAERYAVRLIEHALEPQCAPFHAQSGTYLVTGGLGALGLHAARWLAFKGARHLVLTSRSGRQDDTVRRQLADLQALGVSVTVRRSDVSREDDVRALVEEINRGAAPLRGIVHAAGEDLVLPLAATSAANVTTVLAAKVRGAWNLHAATLGSSLDLFVCYSSIASVLGSTGRVLYSAANAFLDGLVHERRRQGLPGIVLNWGPWAGGGMASASHLSQLARIGNHGLEPHSALRILDRVIAAGLPQACIADVEWERFRPAFEAKRPRRLLSALGDGAGPAAHVIGDGGAGRSVLQRVREEVAATLGFDSPEEVPLTRTFSEMGVDSLAIADLITRLGRRFAIACGPLVFEFPTVTALAEQIAARLPGTAEATELTRQDQGQVASILETLREEAARTLGFESPADVAIDRRFSDLGMDSLLVAEYAARLRKRLAHVSAGTVFTHGSVAALATHLGTLPADTGAGVPQIAVLDPSSGERGGVGGYAPDIEPDVFAFQREAWPHRSPDLIPDRWRWMFVQSAERLGVSPRLWLFRDNGRIVGHNGYIPVRLKAGVEEHATGWLVDTMVLKEYRDKAVGSQLMLHAQEDAPFSLSLGQTARMRDIQLRLGWKQIAPLHIGQLLVRPERVLRSKLPGAAANVAGMAFRATSAARDLFRRRTPLHWRAVSRFNEAHDDLWRDMARHVTCAVVRDASYLNWKYVDQPGQNFLRLEMIGAAGDVQGIAVWMLREPDEAYAYRRAYLVDLVAPLSDHARLQSVLQTACDVAAESGADALVSMSTDQRLNAALARGGFLSRSPERFLLILPGSLSGPSLDTVCEPRNWFITQGDSDIDRPW